VKDDRASIICEGDDDTSRDEKMKDDPIEATREKDVSEEVRRSASQRQDYSLIVTEELTTLKHRVTGVCEKANYGKSMTTRKRFQSVSQKKKPATINANRRVRAPLTQHLRAWR